MRSLYKMMICAYSNPFCKLNGQAKYKNCHLKFNLYWNFLEEITIGDDLSPKRDKNCYPYKPKARPTQANLCRSSWFIKMLMESQTSHILAWVI